MDDAEAYEKYQREQEPESTENKVIWFGHFKIVCFCDGSELVSVHNFLIVNFPDPFFDLELFCYLFDPHYGTQELLYGTADLYLYSPFV